MKSLINAVKTALSGAGALSYIDSFSGIWITPDEDIVPMGATFPGIGIKDGQINRVMHTNIQWEVHMDISVIVYVEMTAGATPVVGQASPVLRGVLEIADDIESVLSENYLTITGMEQAWCSDEDGGQVIGDKDFILYKKTMYYEYVKQETRP